MVSEKDVRRVAAESGLDVRTVRRWFGGAEPRSLVTTEALVAACDKLGIGWPRPAKKKKGRAA